MHIYYNTGPSISFTFFTQNLSRVLWHTVQAQEGCSRNKHILSVLIQTGIVLLFLWAGSSRWHLIPHQPYILRKALRALTWGLSCSHFHGKDSHFRNQIPSSTSPINNLNARGGLCLQHQKQLQNRISLLSFIENTCWTLSLWHSQRGSPYDKCICLMLMQKKPLWLSAPLHELGGTLVQRRQPISFRWNCITRLC